MSQEGSAKISHTETDTNIPLILHFYAGFIYIPWKSKITNHSVNSTLSLMNKSLNGPWSKHYFEDDKSNVTQTTD